MFGKRVKELRESRKLSKYMIAKKCNFSRKTILRIENDEMILGTTLIQICRLCNVLGVTPNELIPEELYKNI